MLTNDRIWLVLDVKLDGPESGGIDGDSNPADAMTKSKPSTALKRLIDTNRIKLETMEWVERTADNNDVDNNNPDSWI
jgi:hypothetical protein